MTPTPGGNFGSGPGVWGMDGFGGPPGGGFGAEFSGAKAPGHYSNSSNYLGDQPNIYDSKYSPNHAGGNPGGYGGQQHMMYGAKQSNNKFYDLS